MGRDVRLGPLPGSTVQQPVASHSGLPPSSPEGILRHRKRPWNESQMTGLTRRGFVQASALCATSLCAPYVARAQARAIKIGILSDMSGPYSEATGQGDVIAARFAIEDFNKVHPDIRV